MTTLSSVFVVADTAGKVAELLPGARALGEKVYAIVVGTEADAQSAAQHGPDALFLLPADEGTPFPEYAASIAKIIGEQGKAGLVLLPANKNGKCLGAKLAAQLDTALCNDVDALHVEGGQVVARHMVYGGMAFGTEKFTAPLAVVTVGSGVFEAAAPAGGAQTSVTVAAFVPPAVGIRRVQRRAKEGVTVDLAKAKRVVSVGRGLQAEGDLAMIRDFASAIGAEVGCTRPIAEAEHWLESERYIGVSGVMLKNDVFVAVGLSGQVQHMVGASACKTIIAINKDKNAPVFKLADYGIVGDLYKVLPKLIEAFK